MYSVHSDSRSSLSSSSSTQISAGDQNATAPGSWLRITSRLTVIISVRIQMTITRLQLRAQIESCTMLTYKFYNANECMDVVVTILPKDQDHLTLPLAFRPRLPLLPLESESTPLLLPLPLSSSSSGRGRSETRPRPTGVTGTGTITSFFTLSGSTTLRLLPLSSSSSAASNEEAAE